MVTNRMLYSPAAAVVLSLTLAVASGCATKKFVRQEVASVRTYTDTRVGEVDASVGQVRSDLDQVRTLAQRLANGTIEYNEVSTNQVQFDFDDFRLKPEAQSALDQMAAEMASHPRYVFEIRGYADATGPDRYNYRLGRERADEVFRYLTVHHSVPIARVAALSFGEESPVADNTSRDGRAQNRRVQVRMLEIKPGEPLAVDAEGWSTSPRP